MPAPWLPDWPALGISWEDACAYAAWRTRRARAEGKPWTFSLPTLSQWIVAAGNEDRFFVFGNRFRPKWVKGCFSRRRAAPESILRFPRDESVYGAFDMTGSISEWLDGWFDRSRDLRLLVSGSWAHGKPDGFKIQGAIGWTSAVSGDEAGLRLVAMEDEAK